MRAPETLVREAYTSAKQAGAKYILMIFHATETTLDPWDYTLAFTADELAEEVLTPGSFAQVREIYCTEESLEVQLDQTAGFAWRIPEGLTLEKPKSSDQSPVDN